MTSLTPAERELVYALRYEKRADWSSIYDRFPHHLESSLRHAAYRERDKRGFTHEGVPTPRIEGVSLAEGDAVDEAEIWRLALQKSEKRRELEERRQRAIISFYRGPVCLVFMADEHAGSTGTDYARIDQNIQTINDTPGMFVVQVGDIVDNFIVGRLQAVRFGAEFSIDQEWVLAKRVLKLMAPKLLASVGGNHDLWTWGLTGIDYLKEIHKKINPDILYAKYDLPFILSVGGSEFRVRVRHSWKGSSIYNPTHGIEVAAKFDAGRPFDIGVGAHTHTAGICRPFVNGGKDSLAILCGTYKRIDDFPERHGFPMANRSAAVAVIIDEHGVWGTNILERAADYMRTMYKE